MGADAGSREEILGKISLLAASYTPEWRFNLPRPDMGTALACLFASVLEESARDFNRVPELLYREFMDEMGCRPKEAAAAKGFMTFGLVKPDMPERLLPKGWGVVSQGESGSVSMETEEDVYVSASAVCLRLGYCGREKAWELLFDRPVTDGVISLLFAMTGQENTSVPGLIWEYYAYSGWIRLSVKDGTDGLRHTGIVWFAATSDFACLDRDNKPVWAVRVRSGEGGGISGLPAHLPDVFINAAPVKASEPGTKGNVTPGARNRLKKTAGFVSVIRNPGYFFGGREEEPWEEAAARTSAGLRHQSRAVTPGDYEHLARECCGDVERVKCFPGYDGAGNKKWGAVTVVVLLKNFLEGQPYFFKVREELQQFFHERAPALLTAGNGISVACPRFIRMDVKVVLCVKNHSVVMEVKAAAKRRLETFLHPVTGGYDKEGWDMGILPDHLQLKNCLQHVPGVLYVRQLTCLCQEEKEGIWEETGWENVARFPWSLPVPGTCAVEVEVGGC